MTIQLIPLFRVLISFADRSVLQQQKGLKSNKKSHVSFKNNFVKCPESNSNVAERQRKPRKTGNTSI